MLDRRFFRFADAAKDCGWLFCYRFDAAGQLQQSRQLSLSPQFPSFLGTDTSLLLDRTLYWLDDVSRQLCRLSLADGGFSAYPLPQGLDCDQLYLLPDGDLLTVGRQQLPGDWQRHPAWCRFETDTARFSEVVALPENTLSGGAVTVFADTAAAWQFIRTLLLPQAQYNICHTGYAEGEGYALLPLRRDTLEALAQQAMQPPVTAAGLPSYLYQDAAAWQDPYWCRAITRQEADRLIAALESATASTAHWQVVSIVAEEAAVYFAGDCSAQQAAARIQDRVSTYLAEGA